MRRFYLITRDLHLYVGLFLSPFVLVFSVSVFYLVHGFAQRPAPDQATSSRTVNDLVVPPGLAGMQGRTRVDALRSVLDQVGVSGEIDFVRHVPSEHRLIVPVEGQAYRRNRRSGPRLHQLWSIYHGVEMAALMLSAGGICVGGRHRGAQPTDHRSLRMRRFRRPLHSDGRRLPRVQIAS